MKSIDDVDAHVGGRVRLRRIAAGVSQERLGEALGLTFQQIQKYEKGQNRIGAGRLYRIASILSAPVEYFYEGLPPTSDAATRAAVHERHAEVRSFLATPEGQSLSSAFLRIEDADTRQRILDLVSTIAEDAAQA